MARARSSGARLLSRISEVFEPRLKAVLGIPMPIDFPDRRVLEDTILPALSARSDLRRVLWVGCAPYTAHYRRFFRGHEYWTLEPKWENRLYGARRHVIDRLENLSNYFDAGSLDLILCNGVFGWGLNRREDAELAFENCFDVLRSGGELLLGWDDQDPHRPHQPEDINSLQHFRHHMFEPLGTWRYRVAGELKHVFDFYEKPNHR